MKNYYYEVHVSLPDDEGYSVFIKSEIELETENEIIFEAKIQKPFLYSDLEYIDYTEEITEENYLEWNGGE